MIIRYFLITVIFFTISGNGFCQTFAGLRIGLNATKSVFDDEVYKDYHTSKFKPGISAGVMFLIQNKEKYGLYTELSYSMKGRKVLGYDEFGDNYFVNTASYHYVDLPVLFRVKFKQNKYYDFYIQAGPELNYWLGGKGTAEDYDPNRNIVNYYDYEINFGEPKTSPEFMNVTTHNALQIGFTAGVGAIWNLRNANFIALDIRFSMGHSYLGEKDGGEIPNLSITDNFESTNNVITVSGVYFFNILEKIKLSRGHRH